MNWITKFKNWCFGVKPELAPKEELPPHYEIPVSVFIKEEAERVERRRARAGQALSDIFEEALKKKEEKEKQEKEKEQKLKATQKLEKSFVERMRERDTEEEEKEKKRKEKREKTEEERSFSAFLAENELLSHLDTDSFQPTQEDSPMEFGGGGFSGGGSGSDWDIDNSDDNTKQDE